MSSQLVLVLTLALAVPAAAQDLSPERAALEAEQRHSRILKHCLDRDEQPSDGKWWLLGGVAIGAAVTVAAVLIASALSDDADCGPGHRYPCYGENTGAAN